ncbi:M20 family peptidase [Pendulispora rubella]|uniref:M20 family peptidase n=1 Tax=Pendulispora rubella TaxID=2741070 RepID=A0ABZ2LGQ2_9BACT
MRFRRVFLRGSKVVAAMLLVLVAVLIANTLRQGRRGAAAPSPARAGAVDAARVAEHLARALQFKTVSHAEPSEDDAAQFEGLQRYLAETYPKVHAALAREVIGGRALVYTWRGSDPSLRPILLAAHQDVVPVEPGTEGTWTHPPFEGMVADGFVWGRGAIDDKGSVVAILEAVEALLAEHVTPRRSVVIALGCDEEVGGMAGAKAMAASFAAKGMRFEYVLDEGSMVTHGIVPEASSPVALIGLTEKGMATIELAVDTPTGHSSMPPPRTSVGVLARAIDRLEAHPMPPRLTPMTRQLLEAIAPDLSFGKRVVASNLWLFSPLVVSAMTTHEASNAAVRTTTAPTVFHAGVRANVLPATARALVNFRILPGDTVEGVLAHAKQTVADDRVQVKLHDTFASDPPPVSTHDSPAFRAIEAAVRELFPEAIVAPTLVLGATDARHYTSLAEGVYHFSPFVVGPQDLPRVHGTDERTPVGGLATAVLFYERLLRE